MEIDENNQSNENDGNDHQTGTPTDDRQDNLSKEFTNNQEMDQINDCISEKSLNLTLESDNESMTLEVDIPNQDIINDTDIDEVFANPTIQTPKNPDQGDCQANLTTLTGNGNKVEQNQDLVLNTPAYIPATPKWCPDDRICPPGRCKSGIGNKAAKTSTNPNTGVENPVTDVNELATTLLNSLDPAMADHPQSTPFQTPPPSVTYSVSSSHTPLGSTPEHFQSAMTPDSDEPQNSISPIQPPDLFRDSGLLGTESPPPPWPLPTTHYPGMGTPGPSTSILSLSPVHSPHPGLSQLAMVQGDMGLDLDEKPFQTQQPPEQTNKKMLPPPTTMRNRLGMPGQMFPPPFPNPTAKKSSKRKLLNLPAKTSTKKSSQVWSEAETETEMNSEWSEADWSEDEGGHQQNGHNSSKKAKSSSATKSPNFSRLFQQTRVSMTPRSQALSQILDDLYTMTETN